MVDINKLAQAISPYVKTISGTEYKMNCPMCVINGESRPDTKMRGSFRIEPGIVKYGCFNCNGSNTQFTLPRHKPTFKMCEMLDVMGIDVNSILDTSISAPICRTRVPPLPPPPYHEVFDKIQQLWITERKRLPQRAVSLDTSAPRKYLDYLEQRNVSLDWYSFYYQVNPSREDEIEMGERVIMPYLLDGNIIGHVSRHIGQHDKKYWRMNPPKAIFNIDVFASNNFEFVILTEGAFDALAVINGIAAVTVPSENFIDMAGEMAKRYNKTMILLPDDDPSGYDAIDNVKGKGWQISFPSWHRMSGADTKDAGDMLAAGWSRQHILQDVMDNRIDNEDMIQEIRSKYPDKKTRRAALMRKKKKELAQTTPPSVVK